MDARDLLIGEGDGAVASVMRTVLGVEREQHVCETCGEACEPDTTYSIHTAAFDNGVTPCWKCPQCGKEYHREHTEEDHAMDLYDR